MRTVAPAHRYVLSLPWCCGRIGGCATARGCEEQRYPPQPEKCSVTHRHLCLSFSILVCNFYFKCLYHVLNCPGCAKLIYRTDQFVEQASDAVVERRQHGQHDQYGKHGRCVILALGDHY